MLLANYEDFENGGLYDNYRRYPFFARRAEFLTRNYSGTFLIVGCGWGYLVDELRKRGAEAWGCDLSDYAIRSARREVPDVFPYIQKADGLDSKALAGVGPGYFDVVVSEDVLPVLDNPGMMQRMDQAMKRVGNQVVHFVTEHDGVAEDDRRDQRVNWQTLDWWRTTMKGSHIVSTHDTWVSSG